MKAVSISNCLHLTAWEGRGGKLSLATRPQLPAVESVTHTHRSIGRLLTRCRVQCGEMTFRCPWRRNDPEGGASGQ